MNKLLFSILSFVALFSLFPLSSAMAHKVRVFAYESGGVIFTEAKFNSGRPAINAALEVTSNGDKTVLLNGATDDGGLFRFAIPPLAKKNTMALNISVDVGDGHKGSWLLDPSDYLQGENSTPTHPELQPHPAVDLTQLEQTFERVLERELAPIKRTLAESKEKNLTLKDILGGLGYIFGIAGIAAYIQSRKSKESK